MKRNVYYVSLVNEQGCYFDNETFTNLKKAKEWAAGRGGIYRADIYMNGSEYPSSTIYFR